MCLYTCSVFTPVLNYATRLSLEYPKVSNCAFFCYSRPLFDVVTCCFVLSLCRCVCVLVCAESFICILDVSGGQNEKAASPINWNNVLYLERDQGVFNDPVAPALASER